MPLVAMRQLLDEAAVGGYGVGAFNVNNMEQIQAIMEAARETESPVIIQASRGARSYTNDSFLIALMEAAATRFPEIPVALHQDHGNSPETCISAIDWARSANMRAISAAGAMGPTEASDFESSRTLRMRSPRAVPPGLRRVTTVWPSA